MSSGSKSAVSVGIIPAAGSGDRLGAGKPKALVRVGRRTLIERAAQKLSKVVDEIIIAAPTGYEAKIARVLMKLPVPVRVVTGGATRAESVRLAISRLDPEVRFVLIHDAARAFAPTSLHKRVLAALVDGAEAVVPGLSVVDTIKVVDDREQVTGTLQRADLRAIQTPQGFSRALIERAHSAAIERGLFSTDDAALVEALGVKVVVVEGDARAYKITTPDDLRHARNNRRGSNGL